MKLHLPHKLITSILVASAIAALTLPFAQASQTENDVNPELITLNWAGGDMNWNFTSTNWLSEETPVCYTDGSNVRFGDTGSGEVMLDETLVPESVLVECGDYTFSGDGSLAGDMTLTMSGGGTLTINTANTYTGGTVLNDGKIVAGCDAAFGQGSIQINGGELDLGDFSIDNCVYAEESYVYICNGSLKGDLTVTGGEVSASGLHIASQNITINAADRVYLLAASSNVEGGAIYNRDGLVNLTDNGQVSFSWNNAMYGGGAIYSNNGDLNITGTGYLEFKQNTVESSDAHTYGGAIYASDSGVNITGNTEVEFIGNDAQTTASGCFAQGGAIYSWGGATNLSDNVTLAFYQNFASDTDGGYYAARGGALSASALKIEDNSYVIFNENYAQANTSSPQGGAIYAPTCDLTNNGSVKFERNYVASTTDILYGGGGAIYSYGKLNIAGNDHVEFGGNYEKLCGANPATYRLRSVYMAGSELILAAGENQDIVFYDPICVENRSGNATVSFNAGYLDKYNVQQKSTGDIIFSGARAAQYLAGLKSDYTQQELTDSLTTEVYATTNLYGGRLRIEDGAVYKGNGINVAADSNATLRLAGGTLDQTGYDVTLASDATLDLAGENSITASTLQMLDGSTLAFTLGENNRSAAALTLDGIFSQGGNLTISIAGDETYNQESTYMLLSMADAKTPESWNVSQITLSGADSNVSHLKWDNGILYYNAVPKLVTATWSAGQSKEWNTTDKNWMQGEDSYAYKDGVDVVFRDAGSGSVTLEGALAPKSVLVENTAGHDYTWEGSGKLTGETSLTKSGEGGLTINTANDYTGGTVLNEGALIAGDAAAFGTGEIQMNGGTLDLNGLSIANAVSVTVREGSDVIIRNGYMHDGQIALNSGNVVAEGVRFTRGLNIVSEVRKFTEYHFRDSNHESVGGVICSVSGDAGIKLENIWMVEFSDNSAREGGAIYTTEGVTLNGNNTLEFNCNKSKGVGYRGGAIKAGSVYIEGNGSVGFYENSSEAWGGAIDSSYTTIANNQIVKFRDNFTNWASGGALNARELNITGNGLVTFSGNHSMSEGNGGAIYASKFTMVGNDYVVFFGNYAQRGSKESPTYLLRSVETYTDLTLAAGAGKDITFYDTIYAAKSTETVSFNGDFYDKENVLQRATGDIVFSGARAAEDLAALKSDYTQQELTDSLTSEVYATTNLYGGRLRIEDGAIYKGNGVDVAANSDAALRLSGGTLDQSGYAVTLNSGTTLDLNGGNDILADTLDMEDGSTLAFNLGSGEGCLLNLNAVLQTGAITVSLSGDLTQDCDLITLGNASQYDTTMWTKENINVTGAGFYHLVWNDGVLSYSTEAHEHVDIHEDTEVDDFDDDTHVDVDGGGHSLTVKHPVDLVQLAMKNGVVRLEGENNNVVRITLTEDGTLELAAGAGLKVGNIVSMVANGSADLVISGDIEINDIKAYGKPGNKGTLSYVEMKTEGDYTIENMSVSGSLIDIGEGTTMYMVNVDISADTRITDDAAWLDMVATKTWLTKDNTVSTGRYSTDADTTLFLSGDTAKSITLAAGTDIVELTSEMFDTVTMTGTDLWLDMTKIAGLMPNTDYITLQFKNLENALVDVENLKVYATIDGETYRQAYTTTDHGTTTTLYFALPEPTTSTLSLLALAALAARRRRK